MGKFIVPEQFWRGQPFSVARNIFYGREKFLAHTHTFFEFFLVVEGTLLHRKNNMENQIPARSLCFICPDDEHELQNSPQTDKVHIVNCTFTPDFFHQTEAFILQDLNPPPETWSKAVLNIPARNWQGLLEKLNILQFHCRSYSPAAQRTLFRSLLFDVLFLLADPARNLSAEIPEWLVAAREKMHKSENFIVGLPRFIELSGKSQEHLTRCMHKYYGETPTAFINVLRIRKAAQDLLYSRKDTWSIMYDCGFNNYAYFLKCFRENFSTTPKEYLKINQRAFRREL